MALKAASLLILKLLHIKWSGGGFSILLQKPDENAASFELILSALMNASIRGKKTNWNLFIAAFNLYVDRRCYLQAGQTSTSLSKWFWHIFTSWHL